MQIDVILKAIENHWVTFIISTWVIYYLFKVANVFYIRFERKMINTHAKYLKDKWQQTIEKNNLVHQLLYKALYEYKGDRAYIFEYHNGGNSISGIDFLKASNTFEVLNAGISPQQANLQGLPVGMFAYWNMKILQRQNICTHVEELKKEDVWVYQMLAKQEIKWVIVFGLYDAKGYPIGFFGIDYVNNKMPVFNEKQKKDLEVLSYQISGLLY